MGDLQGSRLGPGGLWGSLNALPVSLTEVCFCLSFKMRFFFSEIPVACNFSLLPSEQRHGGGAPCCLYGPN